MLHRREFLKACAGLPFALAGRALLAPTPAFAASTDVHLPLSGYVSNDGDPTISYAFLRANPNSNAQWLANLPMNMPIVIFGSGPGDELDPGNTLWYQVHTALGSGWIYSGVVTEFTPDELKNAERAIPTASALGPVGDAAGPSIAISLSLQHLCAYDGQSLVLDTDVTTGMPELATPQGNFRISGKYSYYTFHSPWPPGSRFWYPDSPTTYAMLFRSGGFFIHDSPWRPFYGQGTDFTHLDPDGVWREGSHGCVNVPFDAAAALYHWAPIGTLVEVGW